MQRAFPTFKATAKSHFSSASRSYSTASPSTTSTNYAPYFLGAGLVGAGAFYYSTLGDKQKTALELKAKSAAGKTGVVAPSALSGDEFRSFKLAEIIPYNHNTNRFIFDLPEGTSSGLSVASALVVKSATEGQALGKNGKPAIKPYTPVTAPGVEGKLELMVKHYPGGVMTDHLWTLKPGDELAFKGPIPKFAYKANEFETIGLIAGGSGVTPMYQIMQEIDANPADKTKVVFVFGNVTEEDILLRKEFEDLSKRKPEQFKIHFVLDKPPSGWKGPTGYIDQKVLAQALPGPAYGDKIKLFVCGPPGQVKAISGPKASMKDQGPVQGVLADLGYTESQVFKF